MTHEENVVTYNDVSESDKEETSDENEAQHTVEESSHNESTEEPSEPPQDEAKAEYNPIATREEQAVAPTPPPPPKTEDFFITRNELIALYADKDFKKAVIKMSRDLLLEDAIAADKIEEHLNVLARKASNLITLLQTAETDITDYFTDVLPKELLSNYKRTVRADLEQVHQQIHETIADNSEALHHQYKDTIVTANKNFEKMYELLKKREAATLLPFQTPYKMMKYAVLISGVSLLTSIITLFLLLRILL